MSIIALPVNIPKKWLTRKTRGDEAIFSTHDIGITEREQILIVRECEKGE